MLADRDNKEQISESDLRHTSWYSEADDMTVERLPEFIRHLTEDYGHDYGTICHAIAAGMVATITAMHRSPHCGISGFQAQCIMWSVLERAFNVTGPARLLRYEDALYPQNSDMFTTIPESTMAWLKEEAARILLSDRLIHPDVTRHLKAVADGEPPFGLSVLKES